MYMDRGENVAEVNVSYYGYDDYSYFTIEKNINKNHLCSWIWWENEKPHHSSDFVDMLGAFSQTKLIEKLLDINSPKSFGSNRYTNHLKYIIIDGFFFIKSMYHNIHVHRSLQT